ncbi:MAG: hypothetical protein ACTHN5_03480 [Phycisphaerae bacterium]
MRTPFPKHLHRLATAALPLLMPVVAHAAVLAQQDRPAPGIDYGWIHEMVMGLLAAGVVIALVYFFRPYKPGGGLADFRILVEGGDVNFKGRFPSNLELLVTQFLVDDCQIPGKYEIRGNWEEGRLAVTVLGDHAKFQEQRIRNFLKMHVKRPG